MDGESENSKKERPRSEPWVKGRVETRYRRSIRCVECSAIVSYVDEVQLTDICRNCNADIHTCRNCKFFDPGSPNQCMRPVAKRMDVKNERNSCPQFSPKILLEKAVSEKKEDSSDAARRAFDDLFKS